MPVLKEYLDANGRSPFSEWFNDQSAQAAAKVTAHLARFAAGNLSNVDSVGGGVHEKRIDWGPGLRVYFGNDGDQVVILLAGSEKKDQKRAIAMAQRYWHDYRMRKRSKTHGTD